jgi:nucleotide-binding universal stress UspA family protein
MDGIKHLLVATDLSSGSFAAIDRGFLLAGNRAARLTILHAVGIDALAPLRGWLGGDADAVSQKLLDEAGERLAEQVAESASKDRVAAELRVERGLAGVVIPEFCANAGVDLVLLGAHGSGFLQRMVLGSTASRLLRKCPCPVLVVKQEVHKAYRRVLVPVDFSPGSEVTVRIARELAPGAELVLLHVFAVPFEGKMQYAGVSDDVLHQYRIDARAQATQQLHELARSAGLTAGDYSGVVVHGDATRHIIEHEEKYRTDLLVMGKHGTHVTEELLLGSVTKRVLSESRSDVLVMIDPRQPALNRVIP